MPGPDDQAILKRRTDARETAQAPLERPSQTALPAVKRALGRPEILFFAYRYAPVFTDCSIFPRKSFGIRHRYLWWLWILQIARSLFNGLPGSRTPQALLWLRLAASCAPPNS